MNAAVPIFRRSRTSKIVDRLMRGVLWAVALTFVAVLILFVGAILKQGWPVLNLGFLTKMPETLDAGGGIKPQIFNSIYLVVLSLGISLPVGLGAASTWRPMRARAEPCASSGSASRPSRPPPPSCWPSSA